MADLYRSVFDIIGPVMVGPSSSHTAGAVAIGQVARELFGALPQKVTVHYYGSFAQTHRGHGTDYAIAAGILGFATDDLRVPKAPQIAREHGVDIRFVEEVGESPIHHPNTAIIDMKSGDKQAELSGCSVGGGTIEVRGLVLDGIEVQPAGPLPVVLLVTKKHDQEQSINLTKVLEAKAPFSGHRIFHGDRQEIHEYDIKNYLQKSQIKELKREFPAVICLSSN